MNPKLRQYLESIGLKANASDADANRFWQSLEGDNRTKADGMATTEEADEPVEVVITTDPVLDAGAIRKAERDRVAEIRGIAEVMSLGDEWASEQIIGEMSADAARKSAFKLVAAKKKPISIAVGEDHNKATIGIACADALLAGSFQRERLEFAEIGSDGKAAKRDQHPRSKAFSGKSSLEICRDFLQAHGVPVEGVHRNRIAQMVFDRSVMGSNSTSDFPYTLANVLNKSLTRMYQEIVPQWTLFCVKGTIPDFKQIQRTSFGEVPNLSLVTEGEEYSEFTIGERKEVYSLKKYGKKFSLTWEALVNDDLSAFTRVPSQMITAARRQEDDLAFAILTNGTSTATPYVMGDTHALFDQTYHANVATATAAIGAPTVTTLNYLRTTMATQTGISSNVKLNLAAKYLIAPQALAGTVDTLLNSPANPAASQSGVVNIWQNKLIPIYNARLDSDSAVKWYATCDPSQIDTIEVGFLAGYDSPTLDTIDNMSPDRREYYIRHIAAAKALDWRGMYYNPGA